MANRFLAAIELVRDAAARGGFRVALIGGFALPFHGIARATGDVDFLVESGGADVLDEALVGDGFQRLHRSQDSASYRSSRADLASLDMIYAHRPAALAMLARARSARDRAGGIPVVDVEGIIGLKAQAIANDPRRRRRDEDDIVALLERHAAHLDLPLVRSYFDLLESGDTLERLLGETRERSR